ncbi:efflux RND transporter periplasmic adaptor subunit [candidate division KSB1 bacterium]
MKSAAKLLIVTVLTLTAVFLSCGGSETDRDTVESLVPEVRTMEVKRDSISRVESFTGDIRPVQIYYLSPDVPGRIARIYVKVGDRVKKGQLLARLDTRMAELQVKQAEAGLQVARASLSDAERNWERMQSLEADGAISPQQIDKMKLAFESARAQAEQAGAGLDLARHNLEVSTVRAPIDGVITAKSAEEGAVINPGMLGGTGVLTLMDISTVEVEARVPQEKIGSFRTGQRAEVSVSYRPNQTFPGRVSMVNYAADPVSRMFDIKIILNNPDLILRAGTFAGVAVAVETHHDIPVVPLSALVQEKYVFTLNGEVSHRNEVTVGIRNQNLIEITEGLEGGEKVVIQGAFGLSEGARVKLITGESGGGETE